MTRPGGSATSASTTRRRARPSGGWSRRPCPTAARSPCSSAATTSANGKARTQGVLDELADARGQREGRDTHVQRAEIDGKMYGKYFLVDGEAKTDGGPDKSPEQYPNAHARPARGCSRCLHDRPVRLQPAGDPGGGQGEVDGRQGQDRRLRRRTRSRSRRSPAGEIEGTVVQDPYNYGYKSVEVLAAEARGDKSKIEQVKRTVDAVSGRHEGRRPGPGRSTGCTSSSRRPPTTSETVQKAVQASVEK